MYDLQLIVNESGGHMHPILNRYYTGNSRICTFVSIHGRSSTPAGTGLRGGDLRFYPTASAMEHRCPGCQMVRGAGGENCWHVYTDVEPVTFNRGFYSVDMRFYYPGDFTGVYPARRDTQVEGLCVFDKRCILFGSEGTPDILLRTRCSTSWMCREGYGPICLSPWWKPWTPLSWTRVDDGCKPRCCRECGLTEIPAFIARASVARLVFDDSGRRRFYVTWASLPWCGWADTQLLIGV